MRRAPERPGCASGSFFGGNARESAAPGVASSSSGPGRRAVESCWAIRRPSTRTMRIRIAACSPKHAPAASCPATMALRPRCLFTEWPGMPPWLPPRPRSPRQFRLRSRTPVVPSCPVNVPKVSRGCRAAASGCHLQPILSRPGPSVSIRPRRLKCGNVANPCLPVHHPGPFQNALPSRKRDLEVDSRKLRLPRPCRIPAGCLVSQSVEVPSDKAPYSDI